MTGRSWLRSTTATPRRCRCGPTRRWPGCRVGHQPFMGRASRQQPVRRTVTVKQPRRLPRPMEKEALEGFIGSLTRLRDLAMFLLMLDGGLRPGEVLSLHLADLSYGRRRVTVGKRDDHPHGAQGKSRTERVVDLHEPRTLGRGEPVRDARTPSGCGQPVRLPHRRERHPVPGATAAAPGPRPRTVRSPVFLQRTGVVGQHSLIRDSGRPWLIPARHARVASAGTVPACRLPTSRWRVSAAGRAESSAACAGRAWSCVGRTGAPGRRSPAHPEITSLTEMTPSATSPISTIASTHATASRWRRAPATPTSAHC